MEFVSLITEKADRRRGDDFTDRLSNRYSVLLLIVFTVSISAQLYLGSPITCWCGAEFGGGWINYANNICWMKNTYYVPLEQRIPKDAKSKGWELHYYQWLPFILLLQAVLFYMPSMLWENFSKKSGINLHGILSATKSYHNSDLDDAGRKGLQVLITNQINRFLTAQYVTNSGFWHMLKKSLCCSLSVVRRRYLCILYMTTKGLYLLNIVCQFFLLNYILDTNFSMYGYTIIQSFMTAKIIDSKVFPRVTMCDFSVRDVGNVRNYTVQCMLPINMYAEKCFAFIWLWLIFLGVVTGINIVQWFSRLISSNDKYRYVINHLNTKRAETGLPESFADPKRQKRALTEFVDDYLCSDGMLVLQLIGHNTNNMTVADTIRSLWDTWVRAEKKKIHEDETYV